MASSSTSLSLPSSFSTHRWKYDVFLSFRGEDTRQSFTAHLHAALCQKGIDTFKDNLLTRGEKISPALLRAIEESRFSIIIFSENYASSSWCLDELTKILDRVEEGEHTALPVFHNVDPSDVKKQKGSFEEAFAKHEQVYGEEMEKVVKWRKALTEAATISGWDTRNRDESEVIEEIVTRILNEKIDASSSNRAGLVGMEYRIKDIVSSLSIESNDVWLVGIWGMAGIGKTTIAKAVCDQICAKFESSCFLENVREETQRYGLTSLKEKLLQQILGARRFNTGFDSIEARLHLRKVLIILDDVDKQQQLETLVGNHDWFGRGSRIIITTRDKGLLNMYGVDLIYEARELNKDEALKLFHQHAFKHKHPTQDFVQLCCDALNYTKGNPLALKILGRFLCNRSKKEWMSELDKLKQIPNKDVQDVLKISFYGLDPNQQNIFLDIACFFKGQDKDHVAEILESCDFYPEIEINVLIEKSLLTISNNKLGMHDLIQEMGWQIVREESVKDPSKRSRLWVHEDVSYVLTANTGTKKIEGIFFDISESKQIKFTSEAFKKMKRLRLLKIHQDAKYKLGFYYKAVTAPEVYFYGDLEFPSYELRYLHWDGYPLEALPSNFHGEKLVQLKFRSSKIKQLFQENKLFEKLKVVNLSFSQHLIEIPNISNAPNLEILILDGCKNLENLPSDICELKYLATLHCSLCEKLKIFPEIKEDMENLRELHLDGTSIQELPSSVKRLKVLEYLNLSLCNSLLSLPDSICNLKSLKTLDISGCSELQKLPENLESLQCLEKFIALGVFCQLPYLSGLCSLRELEVSFANLRQGAILSDISCFYSLEILDLSYCNLVEGEILTKICHLSMLKILDLSGNHFGSLPAGISQLSNLQTLKLSHCKMLQEIPELPSSLREIEAHDCACLETLSSAPPFPWKRQLWWSLFYCFKSEVQDLECGNSRSMERSSHFFYDGKGISIVMPGSCGIPKWIRHQSTRHKVTIELPMNWHEQENILGFVVCSLYVPVLNGRKYTFGDKSQSNGFPGSDVLGCKLSINSDLIGFTDSVSLFNFCHCSEECASDQVWFFFYPKIGIPMEYRSNQWRNLEAKFFSNMTKMEKCGVDLVYDRGDESAAVDTNVNIKRSLEGAGNNLAEDPYNKRLRGPDPDHETQNSPQLNQESSLLSSYQLFNFL